MSLYLSTGSIIDEALCGNVYREGKQMCRTCGVYKSLSDDNFYKGGNKSGFRTQCKICHSNRSKDVYKLSDEENIIRIEYAKKQRAEQSKINRLNYIKMYKSSPNGRIQKLNYRHRRRQQESYNDGTVTQSSLDELLTNQSCNCPLCLVDISERSERHLDHVIPLSKGGLHTISNLQWLCPKCNMKKSNKLP